MFSSAQKLDRKWEVVPNGNIIEMLSVLVNFRIDKICEIINEIYTGIHQYISLNNNTKEAKGIGQ